METLEEKIKRLENEYKYYHNEYYDKIKKYNSRDEFINDDGLTDEEKAEIMRAILESQEEQEREM